MEEKDLEEVAQIFMPVFNGVGESWSLENAKQHIKENFFSDYHYIAKSNKKIIGFIMAIPLTREQGTELFVDSIAVLPEYQQNGIGKKLWDTIATSALDSKYKGIRLFSNPHLNSYEWYKDMNFSESGWIELYKYFN